jgi:VWFA-related protein
MRGFVRTDSGRSTFRLKAEATNSERRAHGLLWLPPLGGRGPFSPLSRPGWLALTIFALCIAMPSAQSVQRRPTFRAGVELIYVNVVVRDGSGNIIRDLRREDFTLVEDDKPQTISTFDFEEVPAEAIPANELPATVAPILKAEAPAGGAKPADAGKPTEAVPAAAKTEPIDLKNRRLIVLLFDSSSMQPEELERALDSGYEYLTKRLTPADLVAVAAVGSSLQIVQDFTADRETLVAALDKLSGVDGLGFQEGVSPTGEETEADGFVADDSEFNVFNTDRRLAAIEQLSEALAPIQQKKSIVYFSSGVTQRGEDNQVQLRLAIDRAVKANVSIYPVDARGLTAIVPGGSASQSSGRGGTSMFSGRGVSRQFDSQAASQDTLVALASDTGGKAFLDTNDFAGVYTKVIADTSAYYLLGYSSTNAARDGRFRRIRIKVNKPGLKIEHRNGYYAGRDFQHSGRDDRERQLQEQLMADLSSTDLTVWMSTAFFRLADDRYYVPVSIAVPGSEIPFVQSSAQDRATIDVIGLMRDSQQRPVGRLRDTVKLAVQTTQEVKRKSVQYETGFTLPPGQYRLKVVLRENQTGAIGSYERDVVVPDMRRAPVKLSSVVLGTQTQAVSERNAVSPLARNGTMLVPSLTHVVATGQPLYFYYEVYEPAVVQSSGPRLLTSIAFYRGKTKTYETPLVEVTKLDAPDRKAAIFQYSVPASALKPGYYTCQVTVVDDVAGTFAFPRLPLLVR